MFAPLFSCRGGALATTVFCFSGADSVEGAGTMQALHTTAQKRRKRIDGLIAAAIHKLEALK
jgi:hypothetical protein